MGTNWQGIKCFVGSVSPKAQAETRFCVVEMGGRGRIPGAFGLQGVSGTVPNPADRADAQSFFPTDWAAPPYLVAWPVGFPGTRCNAHPVPEGAPTSGREWPAAQVLRVLLAAAMETRLVPGQPRPAVHGQCGTTNFCVHLQVDKFCPLTLVLQARWRLVLPSSKSSAGVSPASFGGVPPPVPSTRLGRDAQLNPQARTPALLCQRPCRFPRRLPSRGGFGASHPPRFGIHRPGSDGRERIGKRLAEVEPHSNRGRAPARGTAPSVARPPGIHASNLRLGSHAQKLVDAMLDYVHQHYHRPISLDDLASAMKMNASYLSDLFSQTTGVTFHQFLEEVRLSKARELLRDPRNRVGEVAGAAGYASPDAFRHAFKAHEGLSPEAWRAGQ